MLVKRAALAQLKHQAGAFWRWWIGELVGMLPYRFVARFHLRRARLLLTPDEAGIELVVDALDGEQRIGHIPWGEPLPAEASRAAAEGDVVLILPLSEVLVTDITLPAAAQENLVAVVGYEMDRHTPFSAAQVHYGCRRLGGQTASGGVPVRLAVIPRARMRELLALLRGAGLVPARVQPIGEPAIDLTPTAGASSSPWRPGVRGTAVALSCLLVVALLALPLWELGYSASVLREEAAGLREPAQRAQTLRETRERLLSEAKAVAGLRERQPAVLSAIEELAALLPDNTWIWSFRLNGDKVIIRGLTPSASGLIGRIEAAELFRSVGFSAPITREDNGEQFQIAMRLVEESA